MKKEKEKGSFFLPSILYMDAANWVSSTPKREKKGHQLHTNAPPMSKTPAGRLKIPLSINTLLLRVTMCPKRSLMRPFNFMMDAGEEDVSGYGEGQVDRLASQ